MCAFLFFYCAGSLQSYSFFSPPAVFNLPLLLSFTAIFICAYLIHCLIAEKDQQSIILIPILTLFTTLFITINSHFEVQTSQNSFLYFTLLLPLFYAYILSYNLKLLIANNIIVIVSYSFTAVIGETAPLVFILNLVFLFTLVLLTIYSHIRNNNDSPKIATTTAPSALGPRNSLYLRSLVHDIRQPLSSLSLYSHLIEKQLTNEKQHTLVNNFREASSQLERWLSSLLELATLDSKSQKINLKNIPLKTCLSSVIKRQEIAAVAQGMILKTRIPKAVIHTDSKILNDIIDNLLSNALLHGQQQLGTHVLLTARFVQDEINLQVWNKGPRISNEHINSLFDELYYSKNPAHNKAKGLGLGLALSQRKAQLLNSKIEVKTSDNGSCFSIRIPKGIELKESNSSFHLSKEKNEKILLIDDDAGVLGALSMLLDNWGYSVYCAANSEQAINALNKQKFAMIISDYRLPGQNNGIELIKIANEIQKIPSLLLTGEADPDKLKEGELKDYRVLQKPIKPAALRLLLRQVLS